MTTVVRTGEQLGNGDTQAIIESLEVSPYIGGQLMFVSLAKQSQGEGASVFSTEPCDARGSCPHAEG